MWIGAQLAVPSSHFSLGAAPQVGQRIARIILRAGALIMEDSAPDAQVEDVQVETVLKTSAPYIVSDEGKSGRVAAALIRY
jgi:hypothetical protein